MSAPTIAAPVRDARDPLARIDALLDPDSVRVLAAEDGTGVVTALGTVRGVASAVFATDPRVQGGALGSAGCAAIADLYDVALLTGRAVVGIWHSGGARLAEGAASLDGVGRIFAAMTHASGKVPQVSVVLGPAAGGAAYGPALTDVVILGPAGRVFVTGPDVVRSVTGEDVDMARLGGPEPHGRRSGVVHLVSDSDEEAIDNAAEIVELLGAPRRVHRAGGGAMSRLMPESPRRAYDVRPLVAELLDERTAVELHPRWATSVTTTLGRLGGGTVGVIANNPMHLGGCLDASSAEKAARFVRMCDAFGLPLVVLVDVPGYLPGVAQEWDGVVRRGAKLLHAFAEATVPRVTVMTRKAYGGAYIAMNSRSLGATRVFAWPDAELAVMGATAAVRLLHRRALAEVPEQQRAEVETQLVAQHEQASGGIARASELGLVDEIVEPDDTRAAVSDVLSRCVVVRGRHGNLPL
ncbi:MAG TPA: carboxyl transferase domain-containing protein [Mycobacteriales bacterium]|jgi:acetyl-CoA/propionyl-CoA carboxylase carboxyl transferase subunit|nr:carboxyl transferase domain-containing protein [Mycobacteriales bacterium]